MARPGIMLYFDILDPIRVLPDADKGRLLVAMLEYGKNGTVPEFEEKRLVQDESIQRNAGSDGCRSGSLGTG